MTRPNRLYDPVEVEEHRKDRRLVFLALTIVNAALIIADIASDIGLRARNLSGIDQAHGASALSWDLCVTVAGICWIWMARRLWKGKR